MADEVTSHSTGFWIADNEMQIWSVRVRAYQMVQERDFCVTPTMSLKIS